MSEKNEKEKETSQASLNGNKINNFLREIIEERKIKKKFYCLYKNGTKYIVKKKEKKKFSLNDIKFGKKIKLEILENIIHKKFISKYKEMPNYYNSIIVYRLIHNIGSHIVSLFKEYLIYGDIYEFCSKYYNKRKSIYLLKEILNYYIANNILYPNYVVLPEGNYLFRNIQLKQRIIDNQQENLIKQKNEQNNDINKKDDILTSKVIDSILNQTDTSEARNYFGLEQNSNEYDDINEINLLIENINKIEESKNIVFQKKPIKIVNHNNKDIKAKNYLYKICQYINKNKLNLNYEKNSTNKKTTQNKSNDSSIKKSIFGELISTISRYEDMNKKHIYLINSQEELQKNLRKFNSINIINNSTINNNRKLFIYNENILYNNKKMNTIEVNNNDIDRQKLLYGKSKDHKNNISSNNLNYSFLNFNSPYVIKRPVKQSTSYSKKKAESNDSFSNKINLKKNNNNNNNSDINFSPYKNYFNIDNNTNDNQIYIKKNNKLNTINIDTNIDNKINKHSRTAKRFKKYLINKTIQTPHNMNTINYNNDEPKIYRKIRSEKLDKLKMNRPLTISVHGTSSSNTYLNKPKKYSLNSYNFKNIEKIIKRKFIIGEDELNGQNNLYNNVFHSQNKAFNNSSIKKNNTIYKLKNSLEDNNLHKNIFISNNITNNNYYTIENNSRKIAKYNINKYLKKDDINKKILNKILILNKKQKLGNNYLKTEYNNISSNNNTFNSTKYSNRDDLNNVIRKRVISPYKRGKANNTTLTSIDKKYLKNLIYKLNNKCISKDKNENKNKLSYNINTSNLNEKYKTINTQTNIKKESKIREKKRYLILRDNKNINLRNLKKNNKVNKIENIDINKRNIYFKNIDINNDRKLKISNLSTRNAYKNNKIKFDI